MKKEDPEEDAFVHALMLVEFLACLYVCAVMFLCL